ncbi:MAG: crossover junction endodeoxyribonuclease RuvC [Patescibacteria group bacterium]
MPKRKNKIILGIDPGLARTGFGVISRSNNCLAVLAYGTIDTKASLPFPNRLILIHRSLDKIITKWRPDIIAVEELFFHRNATTAFTVGQARGVIILCAVQHKKEIISCKPLQVKRALTGYGQAKKKQMQKAVAAFLNLSTVPSPDDTADALAVAICGERLSANSRLSQ